MPRPALLNRILPAAAALGLAALAFTAPARSEAGADGFGSVAPGAFRSGILFHSSVPVADRAALLADLAWLAGLGRLPESAPLSRALGLGEGDVTGARLVEWVADTVHMVHAPSWCPQSGQVIVSNLNARFPRSLYATSVPCAPRQAETAVYGHVTPYLDHGTYASWRKAKAGEADGFVVDDRVLVEPRGGASLARIVALSSASLFGDRSPKGRVLRLSTLVHEAAHIAAGPHVDCQPRGWARATDGAFAFGYHRIGRAGFAGACDRSRSGAYPVEAMLTHALRRACRECGADPAIALAEARQWSALEVPLKAGTALPPGFLATVDPKGKVGPMTHLPPREYLVALTEARELPGRGADCGDCAGQAAAMRKALSQLDTLAARGGIDPAWNGAPATPRDPTPAGGDGMAWLRSAIAAKGSGHNVALRHAPPCAELPRGCKVF